MSADASSTPPPAPYTLRLVDHLIVIDCVRAARLEPRYARNADEEQIDTFIWFHGLEHPVSIRGDHLAALAAAIEAREVRRAERWL